MDRVPVPTPEQMSDSVASSAGSAGSPPFLFRGMRSRVVASIGVLFGGAILLLLYLGFLATRFPWYSNLVVVLVIFIGGVGALAAMWASWGMRFARESAERLGATPPRAPPMA